MSPNCYAYVGQVLFSTNIHIHEYTYINAWSVHSLAPVFPSQLEHSSLLCLASIQISSLDLVGMGLNSFAFIGLHVLEAQVAEI